MGCGYCAALKSKEEKNKDNKGALKNTGPEANLKSDYAKEEEKTDEVDSSILNSEFEGQVEHFPEVLLRSWNSGRWSCNYSIKSCIIPENVIETDYLLGKMNSICELDGKEVRINFKDMTLSSEDGNYPVKRLNMNKVKYGWEADDGTVRPFCLELSNILEHSRKKIRVLVRGEPFEVDLAKNTYTDLRNAKGFRIKEIVGNQVLD